MKKIIAENYLGLRGYLTKCQRNSAAIHFLPLWHTVQALLVHWVRHVQHVAISVQDCVHNTARIVLDLKISLSTKAQSGETCAFHPSCLTVAMVTDAVVSVFVLVEQNGVEPCPKLLVHTLRDRLELFAHHLIRWRATTHLIIIMDC